jgi:hypothetical protein
MKLANTLPPLVLSALLSGIVAGCAADPAPSGSAPRLEGETGENIIGTQRSAAAYSEAVRVQVNNAQSDFCSGVLIAPSVLMTAAHCIVFNQGGTWTITAPFTATGSQVRTASNGEPMDPAFYNVTYADYDTHSELHDTGLVYLDTPITGVTFPSLTAMRYPPSGTTPAVSAVGRMSVNASAGLVLSAAVPLSPTNGTTGYPFDNKTPRVTNGGDSGGPLFLDGTHTLVGTETRFNPTQNIDFWIRLDGSVYDFISNRVASHGGWGSNVDAFRDQVSSALCARVASCCKVATPAYSLDSAACHAIYDQLGYEATARATKIASPANVSVDAAARDSCMTKISDTANCAVGSAELKSAVVDCIAALVGKVAVGGACVASVECANDAVCERDATGIGSCKALRTSGQSCQMIYTTGTNVTERENLAQDFCSKRGGGDTGLYCDAYDFVANDYRAESTWKCAGAQGDGSSCSTDQYCTSHVCAPYSDPAQFTCVESTTSFVTPAVCSAFSN